MALVQDPIILLDGVTTAVAGPSLGMQGNAIALGGSSKQVYVKPYEFNVTLVDSTTGATGTVVIETAPVGGSVWTTVATITFAALTAALFRRRQGVGKLTAVYIRARVTAIAGGSAPYFNGYIRFKS